MGLGQIGREVARRAVAFDMNIVYAGRRRLPPETEAAFGPARHVPLDELLSTADYVSLHTPLTDETRHLLDAERLALLKPTAFVINTARGALIDQDALADALEKGALAGRASTSSTPNRPPRPCVCSARRTWCCHRTSAASPARPWSVSPWPPYRT